MRLPAMKLRGIVHADVLNGIERLGTANEDVAHVADIEDAGARPHCHVLVDDAAAQRSGIFNWHIPAAEFHHPRAHLAMNGVQRSFSDGRRLNRGQDRPQNEQWLAAGMV
jgi:hypothetical protein